jgi:hypothetical protein
LALSLLLARQAKADVIKTHLNSLTMMTWMKNCIHFFIIMPDAPFYMASRHNDGGFGETALPLKPASDTRTAAPSFTQGSSRHASNTGASATTASSTARFAPPRMGHGSKGG